MRKIARQNLNEVAYDTIKAMILNEELKPGERIIQERLARELGVSRTTLWRAISELAKEHLVKIDSSRGIYVRNISNVEMVAIFEIRAVLEGLACKKAALVIDKERLAGFKRQYEMAMREAKKGRWEDYEKADKEFHAFVLEARGPGLLEEMTRPVNLLASGLKIGLIRPPRETFTEHLAIIKALKDGDQERAEHMMRDHILRSAEALRKKSEVREEKEKRPCVSRRRKCTGSGKG